jgi:hypothetical protein
MPGINFHGDLQEVEGPNCPWRVSVFDGQLPLNLAARATEPSVVGAFVRAALAHYRESKQQSNKRNHSGLTQRSFEE